ncbi:glycosyltransferase family 4 protein [Mesobacillus selenatarsenatis]|uniref:Glycosyltransferase family 4 protein n=1 Tax=Mesobacillus selenatarsenatis TaxID=388741 RepID=A0A846TS70_9BACI|nr:glycosyltransferase family 4 protein [Mesobacillus selenatarsenatis]NKE04706.1 glycosyltransferase family 4 protein [Mesobacillus selenatarsenatis]
MKICVIGPVNTSRYYGGVSTFTESLADGLNNVGANCKIVTDFTEKKTTSNGTDIVDVFNKPTRKNSKLPRELYKVVVKEKPDYILTSLEYGLINKSIKNSSSNIKTIHYLHGFMSGLNLKKNNGLIKGNLIKYVTKYICLNSDYVISNSSLTASMNYETIGIPSNAVINLGISYDFIKQLDLEKERVQKKKSKLLYVGRLVKSKNVDKLINAINNYKNNVTLDIIGDGPELESLKRLSQNNPNIIFHGKKETEEVVQFYKEAEIFISLNPNESFGITYLEALAAGCKLITPYTGGQLDKVLNYPDRLRMVNPLDEWQISNAVSELLDCSTESLTLDHIVNSFSFDNTAIKLNKFINSIK